MKLNEFIENIPPVILERGHQYFVDRRVLSLEEDEEVKGLFFAEVEGNENYFVSVDIEKNEIKSWECDCPFEGEICKHVAAVLYAITEDKKTNDEVVPKKGVKKQKSKPVETIFNKVSKDDLKEFIISQFSHFHGLKNGFIAYFAEHLDEDTENKYKTLVKNIIKSREDRQGFIDYRSANSLERELNVLLYKAQTLLETRNLLESLAICKIMIEEVPKLTQYMDDSGGGVSELVDFAFDIFTQIVKKAPPELKDKLFQYCIDKYPQTKHSGFDFGDGFITILPDLISLEEQEIQFLKLVDTQIEIEKQKEYSHYGATHLIKIKVNFLMNHNRKEEAWKLVEENRQYPEFLEMIVDETLKGKDFVKAVSLCFEGIKSAEAEYHYGVVSKWNKKLLSIYESTNNTLEIRKMTKNLFLNHGFQMDYYQKLKATYNPEEWSQICEGIIQDIQGKDKMGGYASAAIIAKIFIEENYTARLLKLLQINPGAIRFIDDYAEYLRAEYPNELILLYETGIKKHAENTGRNIYSEITGYLKNLQKIKGGKEMVNSLLVYFRQTYKNRSAMMEILKKNF